MVAVAQGISQPPNFLKESTMAKQYQSTSSKPAAGDIATKRFDAYVVENYDSQGEERSNWIRVGAAFWHEDGKGINVTMSALPVDGKLVLRVHEPKAKE
jgi:hypothetical protein